MASLLLNLFLNDLSPALKLDNIHLPKLEALEIPTLLYVEDGELTSLSPIRLQRLIQSFSNYYPEQGLTTL